jgi:glycosyltransferase involved in cell wall biosynthesis
VKHEGFVVGWQGAKQHVKDLAIIYNPVLRFMLKHSDVQFHLWGPGGILDFPDALAPRIFTYPWTPSVWQHYMRLDMDIGLAPLDMGETFNLTKSDIRLREYAALGVPFIATDGDTYRSTGLAARGLLVNTESEWEDALELLYSNSHRRDWMREQGRLRARLWTTEGNAKEWAAAYERAIYARNLHRNAAGNGSPSPGKKVFQRPDGDRPVENVGTEIL